MTNLLFRRQFVFSNKDISGFESWRKDIFTYQHTNWNLLHHEDLEFLRKKGRYFEIALLGYMLDPEKPDFSNSNILDTLLEYNSFPDLLKGIEKYNGRYALICFDENNIRFVNDLTGFREVYYCYLGKDIVCGSTPNIIAEVLNLQLTDDLSILAFFNSKEFSESDNTWIGNKTMFDHVLQLMPNHFLDINSGKTTRFWPDEPISILDVDTCAAECSAIIKGTIASAVNRYPVHIGITAGWDTRLLLAASKDFQDKVYYYVNKQSDFHRVPWDIEIPVKLAKKLGFKLNIIEIGDQVDPVFREILHKNNVLAKNKLLTVFYEVYKRNWDHTYTMSGSMGNGLARIYMRIPKDIEISGKNVSRFANYNKFDYAVNSLNEWVDEVKTICDNTGVDIMDLYQMEQENSHWGSLASTEQDIVREEIRPFNNRKLIRLFWSLESRYRYQYYPVIYIKMMKILWKNVLKTPINPTRKSLIYKLLRIIGREEEAYYYYKRKKLLKSIQSD
jgi:hypothetical protein